MQLQMMGDILQKKYNRERERARKFPIQKMEGCNRLINREMRGRQ